MELTQVYAVLLIAFLGLLFWADAYTKKKTLALEAAMPPCRMCAGHLWLVAKWPTAKLVIFWLGLLVCGLGLLALFLPNEKVAVCSQCGVRQ
jgi:hypothetical protein